jgi:hypothetical protein
MAHTHTGIYQLYLQRWLALSDKYDQHNKKEDKKENKEEEEDLHKESSSSSSSSSLEQMSLTDAKRILDLPESFSKEDIQSAYRKQALLHHPDKTNDAKDNTDRMQKINEARTVLLRFVVSSQNNN